MTKTNIAAPAAEATVAVAAKRTYSEDMVITLIKAENPKRAASAKRYGLYKTGMTVKDYLDGCLALHPEEPRYRWRADLAWDEKREFISVAPAAK
jgi:hypothetical protein